MTFKEKYQHELTWHGRVFVMEIFHLAAMSNDKTWTIKRTAQYFDCSVGLVSENLKIAKAIHINHKLIQCISRQEVIKKVIYSGPERRSRFRSDELD